jgi:small subunit ribosomal protein S13
MARIAGVNLPKDKRVVAALTAIFGIGKSHAKDIIEQTKINPDTKIQDLSEEEVGTLRETIGKMTTEGDLKRKVALDVKRLQEIGAYRGVRHKKGLPCRGQRTRYNSRTKKGKKKTVANKKTVTK